MNYWILRIITHLLYFIAAKLNQEDVHNITIVSVKINRPTLHIDKVEL